ncbi:MAG TPA: ATP-binding protein [Polyangia bacterium]|jgi:PAS domain S-box-containing protein|nr:ATP-binding protein [Polyangia bacterium]
MTPASSGLSGDDAVLREFTEAMPQIMWIADAGGNVEYFNRHWYEYTGLPRQLSPPLSWSDVIHPDDLPRLLAFSREPSTLFQAEYRLKNAGGEYRWHLGRAIAITGSDGGVRRRFGTSTDIHQLKLQQERLERSMRLAASLARALAPVQVAEAALSEGLRAFRAPRGLVALLHGGQRIQLIGQIGYEDPLLASWSTGLAPEAPWPLVESIRLGVPVLVESPAEWTARWPATSPLAAAAGDQAFLAIPMQFDGRVLGAVGMGFAAPRRFTVDEQGFARALGDQCGLALERVHLFEQVQASHSTAEAERRRLQSLFMKAPAQIYILRGPEHRFEFANPAALAVAGHRELIGKTAREALPELDGSGFFELLDKIRRTGRPHLSKEVPLRLRSPDGSPVPESFYNFVYQPILGEDGTVDGIMTFGFEVTELVQARRRAEDLSAQMQKADRRKDEFLAMLGHELRNPLSPMTVALRLIRRGMAQGMPIEPYLQVLDRQTAHLGRMVEDLLDVARITQGKVELRREVVEFGRLVAHAIEMVRGPVEKGRHQVILTLPAEAMYVLADALRLEQVVVNLLTNATKYSEPGTRIHITAERRDGMVELRVRDHGIGMDAETLKHVFELFEQGPRSLDRSVGGLGIGLTVVRTLIELHGGMVEARSDGLGQGSELVLWLPLVSAPQTTKTPQLPGPTPSPATRAEKRRRRILVVDDNDDGAEVMAELLRDWEHEVQVCHDGPAALHAIAEWRPEVVLLDIGLPEMDGYQVAERVRADEGPQRAVTLVALTGYGQERDRRRANEAGFDEYLIKPVSIDKLAQLLERLK